MIIAGCAAASSTNNETSNITDNDATTCMWIPSKQQEPFSVHEILINVACLTPTTANLVINVTVAGLTNCDNIPIAYSLEEQCDISLRMKLCSVTLDAAASDQLCQIECHCPSGHDKCTIYFLSGYSSAGFHVCHIDAVGFS